MAKQNETSLSIACLLCGFTAEAEQVDRGLSEAFMKAAMEHAAAHEQHKVEITYKAILYSENYEEPTKVPAPTGTAIQQELPRAEV